MSKVTRLQIELDEDKVTEIEEMMRLGKVQTKKDLFNSAMTLLRWVMKEKRAGRIIASVDEKNDRYKELVMPILSDIKIEGGEIQQAAAA